MSSLGNKAIMAANIKRMIDRRGISMKDLAAAIDVPYTTATSWTQQKSYPRIDKIELMADFFGVSKAELVEDPADLEGSAADRLLASRPDLDELLDVTRKLSAADVRTLTELARRLGGGRDE